MLSRLFVRKSLNGTLKRYVCCTDFMKNRQKKPEEISHEKREL